MNPSYASPGQPDSSPFEELLHDHSPWEPASAGSRFVNYLVDRIVIYALFMALFLLVGRFLSAAVFWLIFLPYGIYVAYYWGMESLTGQTLGKMLTRTRVLTMNDEVPSSLNILGRTLCRFIPFDAISFLFRLDGWHDSISKTQVVKDR